MENNNANNAGFTKTKVSGTVFIAPTGTALPTSATDTLDPKFENVGYISKDGITWKTDTDSSDLEEMGGGTISTVINKYAESAQFTMLEIANEAAAGLRFDKDNVKKNNESLIIDHKIPKGVQYAVVVDTILTNGMPHRHVMPLSTVSEVGDIKQSASDALGYDVTLKFAASTDINGATVREFLGAPKKPSESH
ncbi:hypothetical protein ACHEUQ_03120 [Alloscardovia omnicolens]|uniref:phage tail tube protein n=1 Tax=Alloscardovia omnicolens TaxID=419015 RepID=UPI00066780BE|nr:hypothetical protein [Alloscardovia omnicolens]